ncbi:MAG: aminotransferase class I/II-fold pyridoxal phosphate-dependent enzyme [Lachnospiraceae bacterium]|jgi:histidinol-phosphate aminotransferase|nr:aminotransferase class I/II-fold pyridoxal phosphate-dependent enzyme [Lachnospiraceae bacterium]
MSWDSNIRKVTPYIAGEQPRQADIIKLNTNESPYPPSPSVAECIAGIIADDFRLYPDPDCKSLVHALAEYHHVKPEQVFVGVGSDDVLALSYLTYFNSSQPLLFPDVTYSFYEVWADLYRVPYRVIPLDDDFQIVAEDYHTANGGIIIPNPNAPTGVFAELDVLEDIVRRNRDSVVIIDEAYIDYGGTTILPLIDKYDNLLVVRTFSKSRAMAGVRIGYAIGSKRLIKYLSDAKFATNSYTMSNFSLAVGVASLADEADFREKTAQITATRTWFAEELIRLGFSFPKPMGNFVFATHSTVPAADLFITLKKAGIFVRYWNRPRINNHLRITIGTDEEMRTVTEFLKKYLGK